MEYPTLYDSSKMGPSSLIAFSTGSPIVHFVTNVEDVVRANLRNANAVRDRYSLPEIPTEICAAQGFPIGTRFVAGQAAKNAWGTGGGQRVLVEAPAILAGGAMGNASACSVD